MVSLNPAITLIQAAVLGRTVSNPLLGYHNGFVGAQTTSLELGGES